MPSGLLHFHIHSLPITLKERSLNDAIPQKNSSTTSSFLIPIQNHQLHRLEEETASILKVQIH